MINLHSASNAIKEKVTSHNILNPTDFNQISKSNERSFEDFLLLFTTQLKCQTPDDVVDSRDLLSQLAQFSSVEQQTKSNKILEKIYSSLGENQIDQATKHLGKLVEVDNSYSYLTESGASFDYEIPAVSPITKLSYQVANTIIHVLDSNNNLVYSSQGKISANTHRFVWDGKNSQNIQSPQGEYHIKVMTYDNEGIATPINSVTRGYIDKALIINNKPHVMINNKDVPIARILSVSDTKKNILSEPNEEKNYIDYLGKVINADFSNANLENSKALIQYNIEQDADEAYFLVHNNSGRFVGIFEADGKKGTNSIMWHGNTNDGKVLADGNYKLKLIAKDHNNKLINSSTEFSGLVTKLQQEQGKILFTVNDIKIPFERISSVSMPINKELKVTIPDQTKPIIEQIKIVEKNNMKNKSLDNNEINNEVMMNNQLAAKSNFNNYVEFSSHQEEVLYQLINEVNTLRDKAQGEYNSLQQKTIDIKV